ncbi:5-methylcytosine restriction system specificity protein McrC [Corynebacterium sp. LaCa116]|uniref:5-methylcytosine restriction system specificity protein McrC n=1 Tax=Corynebacterium sp. LaCa116 TaxID=3391423 RepID=UPI00398A2838
MKSWVITENEASFCPGLTLEQLPDDFPSQIRIFKDSEGLTLLASNVTGTLNLKGASVVIEPKVSSLSPVEMLLYLNVDELEDSKDMNLGLGDSSASVGSLERQFVDALTKMSHLPRKIDRVPVTRHRRSVAGRVDWVSTARRMYQNNSDPVVSTTMEATLSTPENISLSLASRQVTASRKWSGKEAKILNSWATDYSGESLTDSQVLALRAKVRENNFGGVYDFYRPPVAIALMLLGLDGASDSAEVEGAPGLLNSPSLYEEFVRTAVMRQAGPLALTVRKDFLAPSFLFEGGQHQLIPDITIYRGSQLCGIADAKYKAPDSSDLYQLYTYMRYAGLRRCGVLSPCVEHKSVVRSFDGLEVHFFQADSSKPARIEYVVRELLDELV